MGQIQGHLPGKDSKFELNVDRLIVAIFAVLRQRPGRDHPRFIRRGACFTDPGWERPSASAAWSLNFHLTRSGSKLLGQNGDSTRLKPMVSSVPS